MTISAFLAAVRRLLAPAGGHFGRRTWCRLQRHHLRTRGGSVVWVRADALPWVRWGARHGFFDVEFMDGLAYLRPQVVAGPRR